MKNKKRGLTLMEILITMVLLTSVIMAMAGVYPAAFRLNLSTSNQTKAVTYAQAVLAEIQNLPFYGDRGLGVMDLTKWGKKHNWTPLVTIPYPFYLETSPENPGIKVTILPKDPDIQITLIGAPGKNNAVAASIAVTISWKESRAGTTLVRHVTLESIRSENYYRL